LNKSIFNGGLFLKYTYFFTVLCSFIFQISVAHEQFLRKLYQNPAVVVDGVKLPSYYLHSKTSTPKESGNSDTQSTKQQKMIIKAPLYGGNPNPSSSVFLAVTTGVFSGVACALADSYWATCPLGIVNNIARESFETCRTLDEVVQVARVANAANEYGHIPFTWLTTVGVRDSIIEGYLHPAQALTTDDQKSHHKAKVNATQTLSTVAAWTTYGLAWYLMYLSRNDGISYNNSAEINLFGLGKVKTGFEFNWK
jgi:hypothetical protein